MGFRNDVARVIKEFLKKIVLRDVQIYGMGSRI